MTISKKSSGKKNTDVEPKSGGKKRLCEKKSVPTLVEIRRLAQSHSQNALIRIADLTGCSAPSVALAACREILDRAYGKSVQATEITGKNGEPVAIDITAIAQRLNARLGPASDERSANDDGNS